MGKVIDRGDKSQNRLSLGTGCPRSAIGRVGAQCTEAVFSQQQPQVRFHLQSFTASFSLSPTSCPDLQLFCQKRPKKEEKEFHLGHCKES